MFPTCGWTRARCGATRTSRSSRPVQTEFGTRTETKNVNSLKSVEVAVRYEMRRQAAVLDSGGKVHQETRHFHEDGYTSPGRSKETAEDYRYFPEPDLEPVAPDAELVEKLRGTIPELSVAAAQAHSAGLGHLRRGDARPGQRRRDRPGGRDRRARGIQRGRPGVVGKLPGAEGQRGRRRARRAEHHARTGCRGGRAGRRGQAVQQAGPSGHRGCARR